MVKIRIEGLPEEAEKMLEKIKEIPDTRLLNVSRGYPNRNSEYYRYYIDIDDISEK